VTNKDDDQSLDAVRDSADLQLLARLEETRVATVVADRGLINQICSGTRSTTNW